MRLTKTIEPVELKYDVTQSKSIPEILSQSISFEEGMNREILKANQNSFIHAELKLNENSLELAEVGFRLRHPHLNRVSNIILGKFNSHSKVYTIKVDLGDPDVILAFQSMYIAEIFMADDSLDKPLIWLIYLIQEFCKI